MFISITVISDQDDNRATIWTEEGILLHLDWSQINNQQQALISDRIWKHHGMQLAVLDRIVEGFAPGKDMLLPNHVINGQRPYSISQGLVALLRIRVI